jgi:hypothetical protein
MYDAWRILYAAGKLTAYVSNETFRKQYRPRVGGFAAGHAQPGALPACEKPGEDGELSYLLNVLDQYSWPPPQQSEVRRLADACAAMLQAQIRSFEVFAQLVARAHRHRDFAQLGALAEIPAERFTARAICELVRHPHYIVRAIGHETLVHLPTSTLASLLFNSQDMALARYALERQALDYHSAAAQEILYFLDDEEGEFGVAE